MTKTQARREVWDALYTTLDNDLNGSAAGWIYGDDGEEQTEDSKKVEQAAREILEQIRRKGSNQ